MHLRHRQNHARHPILTEFHELPAHLGQIEKLGPHLRRIALFLHTGLLRQLVIIAQPALMQQAVHRTATRAAEVLLVVPQVLLHARIAAMVARGLLRSALLHGTKFRGRCCSGYDGSQADQVIRK